MKLGGKTCRTMWMPTKLPKCHHRNSYRFSTRKARITFGNLFRVTQLSGWAPPESTSIFHRSLYPERDELVNPLAWVAVRACLPERFHRMLLHSDVEAHVNLIALSASVGELRPELLDDYLFPGNV